jgi:hypothetical protein
LVLTHAYCVYRAFVDTGAAIGAGFGVNYRDIVDLDCVNRTDIGTKATGGAFVFVYFSGHLTSPHELEPAPMAVILKFCSADSIGGPQGVKATES